MRDVTEILVPWAVVTVFLFAILDRDEARLPGSLLARAWPPATRTLGLVYFGILAVPVHFWRTRRTFIGLVLGVGWATVAAAVNWAVSELVDLLPEWSLGFALWGTLAAFAIWMVHRMWGNPRRPGASPRSAEPARR